MAEIATEAGHYYWPSGEPCYTIVGKNGKERNTTVMDARSLGLVPSVTEVLKVIARPGLDKWKETQLLHSALTLPAIPGESLDDYAKRVLEDSKEQAKKARELGTGIHGAIERYFLGKEYSHAAKVAAACEQLPKEQAWSAERSFAHASGYGGKCDLHSAEWVIDFKTTDKQIDSLKPRDEHYMQLAAYRQGLGIHTAKCGIVYVSTKEDKALLVKVAENALIRGLEMFMAALVFWKAQKKYWPGNAWWMGWPMMN